MYFSTVAHAFFRIEQETSRTTITTLLADLFRAATAEELQFLAPFCLGRVYPDYYNKQTNIGEKQAIKVVALLVGQPIDHVVKESKSRGDIGWFLQNEWHQTDSTLLVTDVAEVLHRIVEVSGNGAQEIREQLLLSLLQQASAIEASYIVRSVIGTLRLGFSDMTILDALSWMLRGDKTARTVLEHAYNVSADMGHVAYVAKKQGTDALAHATIVPGIPVRPAAAERLSTAQAIVEKIGDSVAQPKLDGFRVQIHIWHDDSGNKEVRFFSRNLRDMSNMFPDITRALSGLSVKSVVMEGEAIVHDPVTGAFLPFQETVKRKRKHGVDEAAESLPLTMYLFDVLYLDGRSLLQESHAQRREALSVLCKPLSSESAVQLIEERFIQTAYELESYFEEAMSSGLEGLVIKKPSSHYVPGKRNFNWIKLKRQETGGVSDTIDCVILGYYIGAGKRALFGIGALLVGVYNPLHDRFETVAKIGTGLTDAEWKEQKQQCDAHALSVQPHNVWCASELVPDVWCEPLYVCMIRADDISRSPLHTAGKSENGEVGFALRFPRIMGMRPDKNATQTTSPKELAHLYQLQDLKSR